MLGVVDVARVAVVARVADGAGVVFEGEVAIPLAGVAGAALVAGTAVVAGAGELAWEEALVLVTWLSLELEWCRVDGLDVCGEVG